MQTAASIKKIISECKLQAVNSLLEWHEAQDVTRVN